MKLPVGAAIGGAALVVFTAVGLGRAQTVAPQDPHDDLSCQDCHLAPGDQPIGPAPSSLCVACHVQSDLTDTVAVGEVRFAHLTHADLEPGLDLSCNACHVHQADREPLTIAGGGCYLCHADLPAEATDSAEATLQADGCDDCHREPDHVGVTSNGIAINHAAVIERDVSCLQCHYDVVDGSGATTRSGCENCHGRSVPTFSNETLAAHSVASAAHDSHLTAQGAVACSRCHTPIVHRAAAVASAVALECEGCHTEEHADSLDHQLQQLFYTGLVPETPVQKPDAMFLARVGCKGCHEGTPADADIPPDERLASINQACLECHGDPYGSLLDLWHRAMEERMSVVSAFVTTADTAVRTQGSSQAVSLVDQALAHVQLVSEAKGLHNIPAAHTLLRTALDDATNAYRTAGIDPPSGPALGPDPTETSCARCHYGIEAVSDSMFDQPLRHDDHLMRSEVACEECHSSGNYLQADGKSRDPDHGQTPITETGCLTCHHSETQVECVNCHVDLDPLEALPLAAITITIGDTLFRTRDAPFSHTQHDSVTCASCHVGGVTLAVTPTAADCSDCHEDHHVGDRACGLCHLGDEMLAAHAPPLDAHVGCDACHTRASVVGLVPDSGFCLMCHVEEDHYPEKSCTSWRSTVPVS